MARVDDPKHHGEGLGGRGDAEAHQSLQPKVEAARLAQVLVEDLQVLELLEDLDDLLVGGRAVVGRADPGMSIISFPDAL